jgi:hypothetical protein
MSPTPTAPTPRTERSAVLGGTALSPQLLRERWWPRNPLGGSASIAPWSPEGLARLLVTNGAGLVLVALGWYQASGQVTVRGQLTWLNVSLAGLGVSGVANGAWLVRGRQAVGMARSALFQDRSEASAPPHPGPDDRPVTGPGMTRFHRATCPLAAGKVVSPAPRAQHERRGLVPCEVCDP